MSYLSFRLEGLDLPYASPADRWHFGFLADGTPVFRRADRYSVGDKLRTRVGRPDHLILDVRPFVEIDLYTPHDDHEGPPG